MKLRFIKNWIFIHTFFSFQESTFIHFYFLINTLNFLRISLKIIILTSCSPLPFIPSNLSLPLTLFQIHDLLFFN